MSNQDVPGKTIEYEQVMSPEEVASRKHENYGKATWGPWLFRGVALASAIFMWWLVLYSHGVAPHH